MNYDDGRLKAAIEESYREQLKQLCKVYYDDCLGAKDQPVWAQNAMSRLNKQLNLLEAARNELLKQYSNGRQ